MSQTQTQLPPPTTRGSNLSKTDYNWELLVQFLQPLVAVDSSSAPVAIALPPAGVNSTTGQTAQNQELIYVKTSSDGNSITITGAESGTVTLTAQWSVARFKSDGTNWYSSVPQSSGGGGATPGSNVWPAGWGGWDTSNPQAVVIGGSTAANMLPGRLALNLASVWAVTWKSFNGATVIIDKAAVVRTVADSETVLDVTPITFGGNPGATFTTTVTSDNIALAIDQDHDYYLMAYFDSGSGDLEMWQSIAWGNNDFGGIYSAIDKITGITTIADGSLTTDLYTFFQKISVIS